MKYVGALVGTMSGSMGGATASRNRGGQYLRQRVVPTNPNSTRQMAIRSYMQTAVSYWQTLDETSRLSWKTYAQNTPRTDSLGNTVVLTGQQAFIAAFVARAVAGIATPDAAPTIFDQGISAISVSSTIDGDPNTIGLAAGNLSTNINFMVEPINIGAGDAIIYLGRPVAPTINYYRGPYQFSDTIALNALTTVTAWSSTVASQLADTPLVAGQRRPLRIVTAWDDGRVGLAYETIATVADDGP